MRPDPAPELPLDPEPGADANAGRPNRPPRARRAEPGGPPAGPAPDPARDPDLFDPRPVPVPAAPPPPAPMSATAPAAPFSPEQREPGLPVQRVSPETLLRGGSKPDAYLYLVADRADAATLLRDGLRPDPDDPPRLVGRPGLSPLLSALEEEGAGLSGAVVLRLRETAAAGLLEADPDRRGGWLLSGGAGGGGGNGRG